MSNVAQTASEQVSPAIALQVLAEDEPSRLVLIDHDDFTIGAAENCDLRLPSEQLGRLHSILHVQGPAIWIETVHPDAVIVVNDDVFRWRALRDGDRLMFDDVETRVHIGEASIDAARRQLDAAQRLRQDIQDPALLSAEELCDRIEAEEARVAEFDRRRRLGWQALMSAMQEMMGRGEGISIDDAVTVPLTSGPPAPHFHELAAQVRQLSETLDERNKSLAAQEALLVESSSQLCETQRRVSRQLDELLERLAPDDDQPGELRVSA